MIAKIAHDLYFFFNAALIIEPKLKLKALILEAQTARYDLNIVARHYFFH
jgi:hypothetical protein